MGNQPAECGKWEIRTISNPPPPESAETVQNATNAFHATAKPPVAALLVVMPAGGMTNNSLVEPNRSTTTLVPTGLRARVAGLLGLTLKSPSDEVNASTGTARPWVKSVSTTVLVSTTFAGPVNTKSAASALWYRSSGDGSSKRVTTRSNRGSSIVTNPRKLIL